MFSQNISCENAKQLLNEEQGQLVDVRTPMEYAQGALPNAINVPLQAIQSATELLDQERPIILYCVSGARTRMAKSYLESMGFEDVHDLGSFRNFLSCE
ncbi:MAG: rhodanese-like domain-containing protein [Gammaproteobacteria bacterium]|jgi:phage shock protein E|nr:rhodanese-like domain-containing protein [Gammaproteobacteria bacterium]MBT3489038.1 rhodanese-like domain-containing protein [Gammaproteobacteria bacterium]MBT3719790.1 rhodanese-like domain-containing protein [Gammaproteobacteria bacterium]MBT3844088.1 rhodanese-like domain-containing protein [Gammaproteobacteria bacterium]MBT3893570.1 rhodanese-like domain-containing protein [Gammaproteobacteria bacterium]